MVQGQARSVSDRFAKRGYAATLAALLSRLLQLALPFHVRPLYNPDLRLKRPIGVEWGTLNHWSFFPSDHAALLFALATLIWTNDRRWGVVRVSLGCDLQLCARLPG